MLENQKLFLLAHARNTGKMLYLALPAVLLLDFQGSKASWRCLLLKDILHGGVETARAEGPA